MRLQKISGRHMRTCRMEDSVSENNGNEVKKEYGRFEGRKDLLRKYMPNNFSIKILSFLAAVIVWMVIVNIEDPYKEKTLVVNVETINEDALSSVNKVYEIIEGATAPVKVRGKKSVVDKLRPTDIRATADLSNLSAVNAVAIVPELVKNVSSEPTLECNQVLKVALENMASKQIKVTVVTEGTPEEGYSIGECLAKPNMIEVTGGQSAVNKIDSVRVTVNVNGASEDFTRRLRPVACDADGEKVVSSTLTYGVPKVRAMIEVLNKKTIPVNIVITGKPAEGYEFVKAECLPEKIEIAGDARELGAIDEVKIPINISGMKSSSGVIEQNIIIQEYLPEGIHVLSDYAQVSLRLEIEKQMQKTLMVPVEKIKFFSLKPNLSAEILGEDTEVEVVLQGIASVLDSMSEDAYTAYVDCEGLRTGRYHLDVKVSLNDSYKLIDSGTVEVRITRNRDTIQSEASQEPATDAPPDTEEPAQQNGEDE